VLVADQPPVSQELCDLPHGFSRVAVAEGSKYACEMHISLDYQYWMCCDIRIPPESFNIPESLSPDKLLLIYIASTERGFLAVNLDGETLSLFTGETFRSCFIVNGSDALSETSSM